MTESNATLNIINCLLKYVFNSNTYIIKNILTNLIKLNSGKPNLKKKATMNFEYIHQD
jgi:hypothetical protein